jgi:hypothetical protein
MAHDARHGWVILCVPIHRGEKIIDLRLAGGDAGGASTAVGVDGKRPAGRRLTRWTGSDDAEQRRGAN